MPRQAANNTGRKYPTLKEVAKLANTSVATASYVLNDAKGRYITSELRERVLNAASELHYSKSLVASGLKGKSRKILTLLIPKISNIFFARIVLGVERRAFEKGYIVHICNTFDDPHREKTIIEQAIRQRVDGIFISGSQNAYENTEPIRTYGIPCVVVERPLTTMEGDAGKDYYFVGSDNYHSGYLAGDYLRSHGHKNICYIEWMRNISNITMRRSGFEYAFRPQIEEGGQCVIESSRSLSAEAGYRLTQKVLDSAFVPSAFLFGHNKLAEGGVACLRDNGMSIPDEVSVMIIGAAEWVELTRPRFTFVRQPADLIGTTAADLLMSLIEKDDQELLAEPVFRRFDCELIEGDTVRNLNENDKKSEIES